MKFYDFRPCRFSKKTPRTCLILIVDFVIKSPTGITFSLPLTPRNMQITTKTFENKQESNT